MIDPTKKRLTIIFTLIIVVFNIVMMSISYLFLHQSILNGARRHLEEDVRTEFLDQYKRSGLDLFKNTWDENQFQILNKEGGIVVSTRNSINFYPSLNTTLLSGALAGRQGFETRKVQNELYLISYFPLDGKYAGRVARSITGEMQYERIFLRMVLLAFPVMLLLSYLVSRYLVNHAMKPISDIFTFQETFSSNVTHELRSPLASIKGNFEVALRRERTGEEYREVIGFGLEEVDRITNLLKNLTLLASSKFKPADLFRNRTNLTRIIKELVEAYTPLINSKRIKLNVAGSPGIPCLCDEGLISRAIENLLDNAIKYTPDAGSIDMALTKGKKSVTLTVSNTCRPLEKEENRHIFEPFYRSRRTQQKAEGTGLGLYIARYIVRSHGGDIRIKDTADNLFSIEITLPI